MSDSSSRRPAPRSDRRPAGGAGDRTDRKPTDRKPVDRDRKPVDRDRKPVDRDRKPVERDRKPVDRDRKPGERTSTDRTSSDRKPADRDRAPFERKSSDRTPGDRKPSDRRSGDRATAERKPWDAKRPDRAASARPSADRRPPRARDDEPPKPRHDDPEIPDDIAANQLDKVARGELKTLSKDNADWVARHLVMAGRLIDDDPALAHRHALAASRRAGRIAVVRESVGITAYALGEFDLALRELRTYRRLSGRDDQLPLMVDSERGIGRPEKALELGRSVPRTTLEPAVQVALAIAMSGARLDLGQPEAALTELQIPQLDPERAYSYSPALFDAYATVLEDLGRAEEAEQWWQRSDRAAIALERAALPEGEDTVEIIDEDWDPDAEH